MNDEGGDGDTSPDLVSRSYYDRDQAWLLRWMDERDRRYAEVQAERDKAETIRVSTQAYVDQKTIDLREQIAQELGRQRGSRQGGIDQRSVIAWTVAFVLGVVALAQWLM